MKLILAINASLFVLATALFLVVTPLSQAMPAQDVFQMLTAEDKTEGNTNQQTSDSDEKQPKETDTAEEESDPEVTADVYVYTAQPGDSYVLMARKATQTYGQQENLKLSPAQIIFIETNLMLEADSPQLDTGSTVTIEELELQKWVEEARELTEVEEAQWQQYVPSVDFNTDAVGEES